MKVGIITIHNSPNYGASLQSFALYKYLETKGYDVEIIDLHRPYHSDYIKSKIYTTYTEKSRPLKEKLIDKIKNFFCQTNAKPLINSNIRNRAIEKINTFNSRIRLSKPYKGIDELYDNPPQYDIYITGSDQVWNPTQNYCIEPYFLTFVKKGKLISFASSIGLDTLPENVKKDYKKWLNKYDAISVREDKAKQILKSVIDKKIYKTPDPTFLLDIKFWKDLLIEPNWNNYILLFTLNKDDTQLAYAKKISKESNKKLLVINNLNNSEDIDDECIWINDAGPEEWLGYIYKADLILTDSFHCSLFSIILGSNNFYTYIAPWNNRGSRIIELLEDFSLSNHLLRNDFSQSYIDLSKQTINRNHILEVHSRLQKKGRTFLSQNG